jgi:hypothetical protein
VRQKQPPKLKHLKNMKKFLKFILILLVPAVFVATFYFAKAEDDENDSEDDYTPKTTTQKATTQPTTSTKVETTTQTTVYKDSDGDGILDNNDPHPGIQEIFIVEDKNLNGIVDKFETYNVN